MEELYYDEFCLAYIMVNHDLGAKSVMELLERVYAEDSQFIHPSYREKKREFLSNVLYWVDYLVDKANLDMEFAGLEKDFRSMGKELVWENFMFHYTNLDLFFMEMRLKIRFLGSQNYVRMKLRTLLKNYGYQRRSAAFMDHIRDCMFFYHIQPYLRGGQECDIRQIGLDDMVVFRVI